MDRVEFYRTGDAYGAFSNFAAFPVSIDGQVWPTTEHFFQAQKFDDPAQRETIRSCASPMIAARLGRDRSLPIRRDWEATKDDVMRRAVLEKFRQHESCRQLLLETGDAVIVEHTANDAYWADGGDGSGKNMLGVILMEVRAALRIA